MNNKNIRIAYIISFLSELYFPITAWLFFYLQYLDFKQIAVLTAVHVIVSNIFEIPTGAFADLFGRKTAIFISFFICSFVMFLYPFTSSFWIFLILEIIGGITNALLSGSVDAIVYDTLKESGDESKYPKVAANISSLPWIGLFISAMLGGVVYSHWFGTPWILQAIVFMAAAIATLGLHEPSIDTEKYNIKTIFIQNLIGFKELFKDRNIANKTTLFIIIGSGYFIASKILGISQAKTYGMDAASVGILFAVGYIISSLFSQLFPKLKESLGSKKILIFSTTILIGSFVFANSVGVLVGSFLIVARISTSTTFWNISSVVLNPSIESKNRATTLSTFSLLTQLPYAILAYGIGSFIENTTANYFALVLGVTIVSLLILQQVVFKVLNSYH